jgi:hypothetical protein
LTVSDGRHAASIAILGNYMARSFATAADSRRDRGLAVSLLDTLDVAQRSASVK